MIVEKIPRAAFVSDIIHTPVRPAVGGLAAMLVLAPFIGPLIPLIAGGAVALLVHLARMHSRPVINQVTHNIGGAVFSAAGDLIAAALVLAALLAPMVVPALLAFAAYVSYKILRELLARSRSLELNGTLPPAIVAAVPLDSPPQPAGAP